MVDNNSFKHFILLVARTCINEMKRSKSELEHAKMKMHTSQKSRIYAHRYTQKELNGQPHWLSLVNKEVAELLHQEVSMILLLFLGLVLERPF